MTTANEDDIELHRGALEFSIAAALAAVGEAISHRGVLATDEVYDVEHAEGDDSAITEKLLREAQSALRMAQVMVRNIHLDIR